MRHRWKGHRQHQQHQRPRPERAPEEMREGVIQHHGRFAFLIAEKECDTDVFLRGRGLALAMDGDRVLAVVHPEANGRFAGEIVRVLKRAHTTVVGVLKQFPQGWAVFPENQDMPAAQVLGFAPSVTPVAGDLAVLTVTRWPTETEGAAGKVTEVLGRSDDVRARITAILRSRGIEENFPKEALAESEALPKRLEPYHWHGREEIFDLPVFTIDGADARDFDDAVSIEPLGGGKMRLGVHIADVAQYVKPGCPVDREAYSRGTSVYLPDRVVPMLPHSLSNNLCSLVPYQERLTMSVFMDINADGKVARRRMANTVIRSWRRFTYEEAQAVLDGEKVPGVAPAVADALLSMGELSKVLHRSRVTRGALDFELPEYKVEVDERGKPVRVALRPRLWSHRLIEEFMLLANESIATELIAAKAPFLHRRHDEPDKLKLKNLAKTLGEMGLSAGHLAHGATHKALQDVLRQAQDHPLEGIINMLMVRSMKQAVYSPVSSGHFGIAAKAYAHFTSPIRRYPDLTAHRAIKALLCGKKESHVKPTLAEAGIHCSQRERLAAEVEYKAVDVMRAELFKSKIGTELDGMVTTVVDSGSFVLCGDTGTEGMLRVTNLKPGAKVKVIVDAVDTVDGKISLSLARTSPLSAQCRVTRSVKKQRRGRRA